MNSNPRTFQSNKQGPNIEVTEFRQKRTKPKQVHLIKIGRGSTVGGCAVLAT